MNRQLIVTKEVIPSVIWYSLMIVTMFMVHAIFGWMGVAWIGRYLGIPGTILIILSFAHSARKRKFIHFGSPKIYLQMHELLGWIGAVLVLVHAGLHFNALLPWAALVSMLIVIASGFVGSYLLKSAVAQLKEKQLSLRQQEEPDPALQDEILLDSYTVDMMKKWRSIHMPLTGAFVVLSVVHILVYTLFWDSV